MATIVLGAAGAVLGGAIGGPFGAAVGRAVGAFAGGLVDQQIVNALTPPQRREGPRLTTTEMQTSTEGAIVGRHWGRARLPGMIIWSTRFEEVVVETRTGGKGGGGTAQITTEYQYLANFAIGVCEGPVAGFGRIWADGKEIDQTLYEVRFYPGNESQLADPLIEAKEGAAPAYRGLAYLVFEALPLDEWGNRIPQFSIEVYRPTGALETMLGGVALIAGNEFGLDTEPVTAGTDGAINRHTLVAGTDLEASLDSLQQLAPNAGSVLLVVPWFGDDLRADQCTIRPKVDSAGKTTTPHAWQVAGLTRATAGVVSYVAGKAHAGGSPNDASLIRCIANLNARGLAVTLCPFIMMDVAAGNVLPNPYSDNAASAGQPVYPWRGRITGSPAAGFAASVDKTAAAATQVATFLGSAAPGDFSGAGTVVSYAGPAEWSYRRFVLHYAQLAALAGGVDSFLIGSEMIGLTQLRSSATAFPFVSGLVTLAADCRTLLGGAVKIGYAADWSEYHSHRPADGSGDVLFNLDPLWSNAEIDFVGIDNYMPLADWRDGSGHLDFNSAGPTSIHDRAYLAANVEGGEYFDWYYADSAARIAQNRTAIADGDPAAEPWVFRQKDIRNWWINPHHERPGGVRAGAANSWTPQAKPVRFIELGCPAVDKGANQPNVFSDPNSSEGMFPYFSNGARDDAMQRAVIETLLTYWADAGNNPVSGVYAGPMIDLSRSNVWAWDARPWPSFALDLSWGDAPNWHTGHWLSGRLGAAPAAETIAAILSDAGFDLAAIGPLPAVVDGVTVGTLTSARSLLDSLRPAFQFDASESDGVIKFRPRFGRATLATILDNELVDDGGGRTFRQTRGQETELPVAIKLRYGDLARDDQPAGTEARRSASQSLRTVEFGPPVIMAEDQARQIAERELVSVWVGRERAEFTLPPSRLALDAGDVIQFGPTGQLICLSAITDAGARRSEGFEIDPQSYGPAAMQVSGGVQPPVVAILPADVAMIDGPLLADSDAAHAPYVGGTISPFRSGLALYRSPSETGYALDVLLTTAATMGVTKADFYTGPAWRWDRVNTLYVELTRGALASATELLVLNGANALLLENQDGEWELLQFATATPNGTRSYILSDLLRGQKGTEHAMRSPVPAGARVVLVNAAIKQSSLAASLVGLPLNWRAGPSDRDIGSTEYVGFAFTPQGKARRPIAPVQIYGVRTPGSGDWQISWTRQTRIGGDGWEQLEVPLGEDSESYQLDILDGSGGTVLRSFTLATPSQAYTAAEQTIDFGGAQLGFWVRVAQISASFGLGIFNEQFIWVRRI